MKREMGPRKTMTSNTNINPTKPTLIRVVE